MSSEIEEILDEVDQQFRSFKSFEVVSNTPYDNHFVIKHNHRWQTIDTQFLCCTRKSDTEQEKRVNQFGKRMKQEWKILEDNLPNSIYVRAYEERKDIMRAVVISVEGSPYSYGLFFFDIFFPKDYPYKPPQLFHHPNYALSVMNQKSTSSNNIADSCTIVCNNAVGSTWDSETSNVYRMLGVIQGTVLMKSNIYSKDGGKDLWLSHMAMLSFLSNPPVGFEGFVKGYFRKYSHKILLKLIKGKGSWDDKSRMFYKLYSAFEMNGSYCKHLAKLLEKQDPSNLSSQEYSELNRNHRPP